MQVSCIIPFYNEDGRIDNTLKQVMKICNINQVICVDDGSKNNRLAFLEKHYSQFKFIRLERNTGKSQAVYQGLVIARGDYVLLLDADLRQFKYREVEEAIEILSKYKNVDMLILRRIRAPFYIKVLRGDTLVSGERIIKKADLVKIFAKDISRYQLESAINQYMFANNKKVYWYPYSGLNTFQTNKWGFWYGLTNTVKSQFEIISGCGSLNYLKHIIFFAREKLLPL